MDFDRLDKVLKKLGISRRKLALAVGILPGTMSTAFSRRSGLSSTDLLKIAEYLNVSPAYLEGLDDQEGSYDNFQAELSVYVSDAINAYNSEFNIDIINSMKKLNTLGKTEAVKRVTELTEIPRYTRPDDKEE